MSRCSANRHLENRWLWLYFAIFYAILANLPFWAAKHWFGLFHSGWFCVEYAMVGLLALLLPRVLMPTLLFLVIVADVVAAVCETYFLLPEECLKNAGALHELPGSRLLILSAVILVTASTLAIAAWLPGRRMSRMNRRRAAFALLAFISVCMVTDGVLVIHREGFIPNPLKSRNRPDIVTTSYFGETRLTRRTFLRLAYLEVNEPGLSTFNTPFHAPNLSIDSATNAAAQDGGFFEVRDARESPNVVLVLLESWGLSTDPVMRDALLQPYAQPGLLSKYQVVQGTVPFYGPTLGGEGRELCGSKIGFHLLTASASALEQCVPARLAALGYHNIAVHGFDGNMFSRADWYTRIGFNEKLFRQQLLQRGLPDCEGAFTGICDAAIANWIGQKLAEPGSTPEFVYWVTLNSHLPVLLSSHLQNAAPCSITPALQQQAALCSWYQLVANVHRSVAEAAMASSSRPTIFVIVGDHAPPFADAENRSSFSPAVVPYTLLIPHAEAMVAVSSAK